MSAKNKRSKTNILTALIVGLFAFLGGKVLFWRTSFSKDEANAAVSVPIEEERQKIAIETEAERTVTAEADEAACQKTQIIREPAPLELQQAGLYQEYMVSGVRTLCFDPKVWRRHVDYNEYGIYVYKTPDVWDNPRPQDELPSDIFSRKHGPLNIRLTIPPSVAKELFVNATEQIRESRDAELRLESLDKRRTDITVAFTREFTFLDTITTNRYVEFNGIPSGCDFIDLQSAQGTAIFLDVMHQTENLAAGFMGCAEFGWIIGFDQDMYNKIKELPPPERREPGVTTVDAEAQTTTAIIAR